MTRSNRFRGLVPGLILAIGAIAIGWWVFAANDDDRVTLDESRASGATPAERSRPLVRSETAPIETSGIREPLQVVDGEVPLTLVAIDKHSREAIPGLFEILVLDGGVGAAPQHPGDERGTRCVARAEASPYVVPQRLLEVTSRRWFLRTPGAAFVALDLDATMRGQVEVPLERELALDVVVTNIDALPVDVVLRLRIEHSSFEGIYCDYEVLRDREDSNVARIPVSGLRSGSLQLGVEGLRFGAWTRLETVHLSLGPGSGTVAVIPMRGGDLAVALGEIVVDVRCDPSWHGTALRGVAYAVEFSKRFERRALAVDATTGEHRMTFEGVPAGEYSFALEPTGIGDSFIVPAGAIAHRSITIPAKRRVRVRIVNAQGEDFVVPEDSPFEPSWRGGVDIDQLNSGADQPCGSFTDSRFEFDAIAGWIFISIHESAWSAAGVGDLRTSDPEPVILLLAESK